MAMGYSLTKKPEASSQKPVDRYWFRPIFSLLAPGFWLLASLLLPGCESAPVVETLPPPNFNGPIVAAGPVAPRPMPQILPPPAPLPSPKPRTTAGAVPREWQPLPGAHRDWYYIV